MNDNPDFNNNPQRQILNNLNDAQFQNNNENQIFPTDTQNNQFINLNETTQIQNVENITNDNIDSQFSLGTTNNTNFTNTLKSQTDMVQPSDNHFINNTNNYNETSLNDLNIDGTYNQMLKTDYSQEPKVRENIEKSKKNTIPITKELKTFLLIALVLFGFIIIMPYIFDFVRNIRR